MSSFSHRPSTGQRLIARISSLSLRSDHGSKAHSSGTRKRKQVYANFETVLEPEEYMIGLGEGRNEIQTMPQALRIPKDDERPRISDGSTLVGVPDSPLDNQDYGRTPVRYKITNPDQASVHITEVDTASGPQPCNRLWEALNSQISEADDTIRLRSTSDDFDTIENGISSDEARSNVASPQSPAAWQTLPPYPLTPPPSSGAALCPISFPMVPPQSNQHHSPPTQPLRLPPPPPPSVSVALPEPAPSLARSRTSSPASLRPHELWRHHTAAQEEATWRPGNQLVFGEPGSRTTHSVKPPPIPKKPKALRHSLSDKHPSTSLPRLPLRIVHAEDRHHPHGSLHRESPNNLSRHRTQTGASRTHHRQSTSQPSNGKSSRTTAGDKTRRSPPMPPKRPSTRVDAGRHARPGQRRAHNTRTPLVLPDLEPLVPQVAEDTGSHNYENLIRNLAGKETCAPPLDGTGHQKSGHRRMESHMYHQRPGRFGNYLNPEVHTSTDRNSRSDVSLSKLEEEVRTSCRVPSPRSSEAVQEVLDKAGIPALVRAVAATYPNFAFALVNARSAAAEKDKDTPFDSAMGIVAGPSSTTRDNGLAMPSVSKNDASNPRNISAKDLQQDVIISSPDHEPILPLREPSPPLERSNSKGKEKVYDALAMPGSWSFDNIPDPVVYLEAAATAPPPAIPPRPKPKSKRTSQIRRTCDVCAEDLPLTKYSSFALTAACNHENSACGFCVQQWIETQLEDKIWNQITCMQCSEVLTHTDIQRHATTDNLERYDQLAMRALLSEDENFRWCLGPGCESGQIHEGGDAAPLFVCEACGYRFCVIHEEPHEGESCGQYDARLNGETFEPSKVGVASEDQDVLEARLAQEASDLATAQALQNGFERKEAIRQSELREAQNRRRRARKQAQDDQIAEDEAAARRLQAQFDGGSRSEKRTSAWVRQQRDSETTCDELVARNLQRDEEKQRAREREEAAAREKLRTRIAQKERAAQKAAEESARLAKAKAAAEKKRAADDLAAKRKRREEEAAGAATVRQVSKQCPSCKWSIQKSQGCNHMRCWKCKHEFCYECLADHKEIIRNDNSWHKRNCGYYA